MYSMPAGRFFRFVDHLVAYKGAVRMRAEKEQEDRENGRSFDAPKTDSRSWKKPVRNSNGAAAAKAAAGKAQKHTQGSGGRTEFNDPSLNPALCNVQPGERVPFLEKGNPRK